MPKSKTISKNTVAASEDELSFSESEEEHLDTMPHEESDHEGSDHEESNHENSGDESEEEVPEQSTKSKTKVTSHDIISMLEEVQNELSDLALEFKEKTTKFKVVEKEYLSNRKELEKRQQTLLKKLGKSVSSRTKSVKKRDPNTIGGFNKKTQVPTCICTYLDLEGDNQILSRPEVVALLKARFEEEGYVDSDTKEIKIPNKLLKKFGLPKGYVFKGNRYQSFLKVIYDDFKKQTVSV